MKKQFAHVSFLLFAAASLLLSSCEKEKDGETNDEEVITTMQLTFVPQAAAPH
jgi:hypothetical protein